MISTRILGNALELGAMGMTGIPLEWEIQEYVASIRTIVYFETGVVDIGGLFHDDEASRTIKLSTRDCLYVP